MERGFCEGDRRIDVKPVRSRPAMISPTANEPRPAVSDRLIATTRTGGQRGPNPVSFRFRNSDESADEPRHQTTHSMCLDRPRAPRLRRVGAGRTALPAPAGDGDGVGLHGALGRHGGTRIQPRRARADPGADDRPFLPADRAAGPRRPRRRGQADRRPLPRRRLRRLDEQVDRHGRLVQPPTGFRSRRSRRTRTTRRCSAWRSRRRATCSASA